MLWAGQIVLAGYTWLLCCNLDTPAITPGKFAADLESGVACTLAALCYW